MSEWKLIDPMDAREGDEYLDERYNWLGARERDWEYYVAHGLIVRRRMPPQCVNHDLVEALEGMLHLWSGVGGDESNYYVKLANAAIARAEAAL